MMESTKPDLSRVPGADELEDIMDFTELLKQIGMPEQAAEILLSQPACPEPDFIAALCSPDTAEQAESELEKLADPQAKGMDLLAWMLQAALQSLTIYEEKGIPESVFVDTMKAFSRFVLDYLRSCQECRFGSGHWAWRHLSLLIFRLGSLEFELRPHTETVFLHIPDDADLSQTACQDSCEMFQAFNQKFFPDFAEAPMEIESWLLSPVLHDILPASSRIRQFQDCFELLESFPEDEEYRKWVFGRQEVIRRTPDADLPEKTSLQRAIKSCLLRQIPIGAGHGRLRSFEIRPSQL